jgi:threonine synthase
VYDVDSQRRYVEFRGWPSSPNKDRMWRFAPFLPLADPSNAVSLGEGATPLLHVSPDSRNPLRHLYVKNETANPTWAFKDRFHSVSISMARQLGYRKVVASSTGNHGVSLAAYAAAAGMRVVVFLDARGETAQRHAMQFLGAEVVVIPDRRAALLEFVRDYGWYPSTYMTPMPVSTPFGVEGYKTLAYEVVLDLADAPDHFLFPVAAGDGFYGPWKGFKELADMNLASRRPRMHAVQPVGANWLVESVREGLAYSKVHYNPTSIALSIADPTGGAICLKTISESGGTATDVTDAQIIEAAQYLANRGFLVEPASAATLAAAWILFDQGTIDPDSCVVCVLTGALVKWPNTLAAMLGARATLAELSEVQVRELAARP